MAKHGAIPAIPEQRAAQQPKHRLLRELLLRDIEVGRLGSGRRVPSENEMIAQYDVSSTTVRRCLNDLAKEGYVYRERGRGTFVSDLAQLELRTSIGLLCSTLVSAVRTSFVTSLLWGIEQHASEAGHVIDLFTSRVIEEAVNPAKALRLLVRRRRLQGLLLMSPIPEEWLEDLVEENFPIVSVNIDTQQVAIPKVMLGMPKIVEMAMNHLIGLGHRRVTAVLGHGPERTQPGNADAAEHTLRALAAASSELNLSVERYNYYDELDKDRALTQAILDAEHRPTALLVSEDQIGINAWIMAERAGIHVPDQLSIVSIQGLTPQSRLTAIGFSMDNFCWRSIRMLEQLLAGEKLAHDVEYIGPGRLIRGETAGPVDLISP